MSLEFTFKNIHRVAGSNVRCCSNCQYVSDDTSVFQIIWQIIPYWQSSHTKSLLAKCIQPVVYNALLGDKCNFPLLQRTRPAKHTLQTCRPARYLLAWPIFIISIIIRVQVGNVVVVLGRWLVHLHCHRSHLVPSTSLHYSTPSLPQESSRT